MNHSERLPNWNLFLLNHWWSTWKRWQGWPASCNWNFLSFGLTRIRTVEEEVRSILPEQFALIFDGWSADGVSLHYVATFASFLFHGTPKTGLSVSFCQYFCYFASFYFFSSLYYFSLPFLYFFFFQSIFVLLFLSLSLLLFPFLLPSFHLFLIADVSVLLSFSPLLEDAFDFTAESHKSYLEYVLKLFNKSCANVVCLVGDNCSTNKRLAELMGVPLVGCASHRFNLACQRFLDKIKVEIERVYFICPS